MLNSIDAQNDYSFLNNVNRVYLPIKLFNDKLLVSKLKQLINDFNCYLYLPAITNNRYNKFIEEISKEYNFKGFVISNLSKFLIYGVVMFLVALFFGEMKVFTCAFGILFHKIIIYYLYLVKDKMDDNKRTVNDLDISNEIRMKLNQNGFHKVNLITEVNRERLMEFLTLEETLKVIESLKKYELFIKGELEAILEDDETVDE